MAAEVGVRIRRARDERDREAPCGYRRCGRKRKRKRKRDEKKRREKKSGKKTGNTDERQLLDWPLVIKSLSTTRPRAFSRAER